MDDKNQPENRWENENTLDPERDMLEEDEAGEDKPGKLIFKIGAGITLLAFLAFSYAWLPLLRPPHLDFLKQDKTLSEEALVRQCKPAVVNIRVTKTGGTGARSQGTGFNLNPQGLIVTNRHVVEGASSVEVTFSDENRYFSRKIKLIDGYDLALVKLDGKDLPALAVADDRIAELGQTVTIIGNPRGCQRISARGQVKEYFMTETANQVFSVAATVAPGSSGSPVLDATGRLVGIVYAAGTVKIEGKDQNRALAIPAAALTKDLN